MSIAQTTFKSMQNNPSRMFILSLRLVAGWLYFSAFWRRVALTSKLDPESAGYIGVKFNHFLPHALGVKPLIEYLLLHPEALMWNMIIFTIIEGIVGLFFLFGFFTRLSAIGVFLLALGILLGSGWLGTTCLDEWQIGVLGIASGLTIFLSGSGRFSLDYYMSKRYNFTNKKWFRWLGSGDLPISLKTVTRTVLAGSFVVFFITLFTNQVFHNGLWGDLHNLSKSPRLKITQAEIEGEQLSFRLYRVEGVDVYGSFLISVQLVHPEKGVLWEADQEELSELPNTAIDNKYIAKIRPDEHSLIVPLGAKAMLNFQDEVFDDLPKGNYQLKLTDISGESWSSEVEL